MRSSLSSDVARSRYDMTNSYCVNLISSLQIWLRADLGRAGERGHRGRAGRGVIEVSAAGGGAATEGEGSGGNWITLK
eukprot:6195875-Pleurochrysis_carterae.AAC.1